MTQSTAQRCDGTIALAERKLVERAKSGDHLAFRAIMERHNRRLYRVARAVMKDDAEAEDVVQETYLRAFSRLSKFRGESSLATWLTRIALNEALGRKRKQRTTVTLESVEAAQETSAQIIQFPAMNTETDPERSVAQREIRKLLERAMDALPEAFRLVFVMHVSSRRTDEDRIVGTDFIALDARRTLFSSARDFPFARRFDGLPGRFRFTDSEILRHPSNEGLGAH